MLQVVSVFHVHLKNCCPPRPEQGWSLPFCPGQASEPGDCQARGGHGKARRARSPLPPVIHPPVAARGHPRTALDTGSAKGGALGPRSRSRARFRDPREAVPGDAAVRDGARRGAAARGARAPCPFRGRCRGRRPQPGCREAPAPAAPGAVRWRPRLRR